MSNTIVAKRYAQALFEAAVSENIVEAVEQELKLVVSLVTENDDFRKFLVHPNIEKNSKINLMTTAIQPHVSPIVFNTLVLLISRGRETILSSLYDYYVSISNAALGQENATVYSAYELTETEAESIARSFSAITGKKIKVQTIVDKSVLGGLRVRIGDYLYDGSLSNKLSKLEKSLLQKA